MSGIFSRPQCVKVQKIKLISKSHLAAVYTNLYLYDTVIFLYLNILDKHHTFCIIRIVDIL